MLDNKNTESVNTIAKKLFKNSFIPALPIFKSHKKCVAFTLAEVLITLLIIGVVASIVIPNLVQDTQDAELKVAWKKQYSIIEQTVRLAKQDDPTAFAGYNCYDNSGRNIYNALKNTMGYVRECNSHVLGNCWASTGVGPDSSLSGGCPTFEQDYQKAHDANAYVARDGSFWYLYTTSSTWACPIMAVDVNGMKGPNQWNKDVLTFMVANNAITLGKCLKGTTTTDYLK